MAEPIYRGFLGDWVMDVDTCDYEQGEPPISASNGITEDHNELVIAMDWTDSEGETHHMSFRAVPNGELIPFNGGPLADHLSVSAGSDTELIVAAFRAGTRLMVATRTLSTDGATMLLEQTVHLPDGTSPTNNSIYHRKQ